ncbi:CDP-alcohol phosphatidyltransferase family protein [Halocatena salina]|uniref:CDP-alcohol phosphatidyltransferase family protein n=1 Tax=Halocatena salina TaxID=2934340 RepID=A0A8T9ZYY6_9EURY|nr:CDP-alcohol phosphatidyltransferase family protein [Halocatena salina]UPM41961.1 CDP-alcohol phosphatidyltransferase family protein [Halocatena salina]
MVRMTDKSVVARTVRSIERIGLQRPSPSSRQHILLRLSLADCCSLIGLLFAWAATVLLLSGEPNWAIIVLTGGFAFDKFDGYVARRYECQSDVGPEIDAFLDVFVYLVTGAVLFQTVISPHPVVSVVVGFLIIAVGGLRLLRFTDEGFVVEDGTSYYRGLTVVHTSVLVVGNYFLVAFVDSWNGWLAAGSIVVICPFMLSNYHSKKTVKSQSIVAALGLVAVCLCVAIESGVLSA